MKDKPGSGTGDAVRRFGKDRRIAPRAHFSGRIYIQAAGSDLLLFCFAEDLSEHGLLCHAPGATLGKVGEALELTFMLPGLGSYLTLNGILARKVHGVGKRERWGVHFQGTSAGVRRALRTFVMAGSAQVRDYDPDSPPT
jgi:hypothetical protein